MTRSALLGPVLGLLFALVGCTAAPPSALLSDDGYRGATVLPDPYPMPDIVLADTSGQAYNLATSPSRPVTLLFFGYRHCPDLCQTVLSDLALAVSRLPVDTQDQVQVVFVTTDPARDTPAAIRRYLDRFDPRFIGLTGSTSAILAAADQVGVVVEGRRELPDGGYEIGHSAQVIGCARSRALVVWTQGSPVGALSHDVALLVARSR